METLPFPERADGIDFFEGLLRHCAPISSVEAADFFLRLVETEAYAALEQRWRKDGWPAGWHAGLEHVVALCVGEPAPLQASLMQLPALLQATLYAALSRHGLAPVVEACPVGLLSALAQHCVCQLEFEGARVKRFFTWALEALRQGWSEQLWRPALLEAAATVDNMSFDVWSLVRDELVPYASVPQLVQIAARHSTLIPEGDVEVFDLARASHLLQEAGYAVFAPLNALAMDLCEQENFTLPALATVTLGYASVCQALQTPYPRGYAYLWNSLPYDDRVHYLSTLREVLPVLPYDDLQGVLPVRAIRQLEHPETGDVIAFERHEEVVQITTHSFLVPSSTRVDSYYFEDPGETDDAVDDWVRQKLKEGFLPQSSVSVDEAEQRPLQPWLQAQGDEPSGFGYSLGWRPDGGELLLRTGQCVHRYDRELRCLGAIEGFVPRELCYAPDGKRLAYADADGVGVLEAASGKVLWHRSLETVWIELAWSPDGRLLHVLVRSASFLTLDAVTGGTLASSRLHSHLSDFAVCATGSLLVVHEGAPAVLLDASTHQPIAWGVEPGTTTVGTLKSPTPAVLWAPHCETFFWHNVTPDGKDFAKTLSHFRLSAQSRRVGEEGRILFYHLLGNSPDGRHVYLKGHGNEPGSSCFAIVDRRLSRHVHLTCLAGATSRGRSRDLQGCVLSPDRRWLLLWGHKALFRLDLHALSFAPSRGKFLIQNYVTPHPVDSSFEYGYQRKVPSKLSTQEEQSLQTWLHASGGSPSPPSSWQEVVRDARVTVAQAQTPKPLLARIQETEFPEELISLQASLPSSQQEEFFSHVAQLVEAQDALIARVVRADVALQARKASTILAQMGEDIIVPWVSKNGSVVRADTTGPFDARWRLHEAQEPYDTWNDRFRDLDYHTRDNLDLVLLWAGLGGLEGLQGRFEALVRQYQDDEVSTLFPPTLETPWSLTPEGLDLLEGGRLKIFDLLLYLDTLEALEDEDFAAAQQNESNEENILCACAPAMLRAPVSPFRVGLQLADSSRLPGLLTLLREVEEEPQRDLASLRESLPLDKPALWSFLRWFDFSRLLDVLGPEPAELSSVESSDGLEGLLFLEEESVRGGVWEA